MIISVHIPKTAGTTFAHHLQTQFDGKVLLDYGRGSPEISELYKSCFPTLDNVNDNGFFRLEPISSGLINLRQKLFERGVEVIHGHFSIRKYIGIFPDANYVIWVREPLERALSHYNFQKRELAAEYDEINQLTHSGKLSFREWMKIKQNINIQARHTSGVDLTQFQFVGIVDDFRRSLQVFNQLFNLSQYYSIEPQNVNKNKALNERYQQIDDKTKSEFYELNDLDLTLYKNALAQHQTKA